MSVTVCECGLAKCYHEGSHDIATKPQYAYQKLFSVNDIFVFKRISTPAVCSGYRPRSIEK